MCSRSKKCGLVTGIDIQAGRMMDSTRWNKQPPAFLMEMPMGRLSQWQLACPIKCISRNVSTEAIK